MQKAGTDPNSQTETQTLKRLSTPSSDFDAALKSLRSRVLLRAGLRWFWVSSLCFDFALLIKAFLQPEWYASYSRAGLIVFMLLYPAIIGLLRVISLRLPASEVARLADYRASLSEQVSTALEYTSSAKNDGHGFVDLLSDRAVAMLKRAEAKIIVPLQREAQWACLAAILAVALCLWRSPQLISWALASRSGSGSQTDQSNGLPVVEQRVKPVGQQSDNNSPQYNPNKPTPTPVAPENNHITPTANPPAPASTPTPLDNPSNNGTQSGNNGSGQKNGSSQNNNSGHSGPGSQNGGQGSSQNSQNNGQHSQQGSQGQSGQQGTGSHLGSTTPAGNSGSGQHGQGNGQQHSRQGNGQQKGQSGSGQSGHQGGQGGGQGNGQHSGKGSGDQQGNQGSSGGQNGGSNGHSANGSSDSQGQGAHGQSDAQNGSTGGSSVSSNSGGLSKQSGPSQQSEGPENGPGRGGAGRAHMKYGDGDSGKPLNVGNRVLPNMPNKSTFGFKIPGANKIDKNSPVQYGRSNLKTPVGSAAQGGSDGGAPVIDEGSEPVQALEHDPSIPAGYRNLVKRYFAGTGSPSKTSHSGQ